MLRLSEDMKHACCLAFIQHADTKEVLNSGTRFDAQFNPVSAGAIANQPLRITIRPNPVTAEAIIALPGDLARCVEVSALQGRLVQAAANGQAGQLRISAGDLAPGIYLVRITGDKGIYVGKMVKE